MLSEGSADAVITAGAVLLWYELLSRVCVVLEAKQVEMFTAMSDHRLHQAVSVTVLWCCVTTVSPKMCWPGAQVAPHVFRLFLGGREGVCLHIVRLCANMYERGCT